MRIPGRDDIVRIVHQVVQPLFSGVVETASQFTTKLKSVAPFGSGDNYLSAFPFGIVSKPFNGVIGYVMNLHGQALAPIILAYMDKKRPTPSAPGETILYSSAADGSANPVTITMGNDGTIKVYASTKVQVICDDIELGQGTLEKVLNGQTFQTFFNQHTHIVLGVTSAPPTVPSDPTHLSSFVQAKKG